VNALRSFLVAWTDADSATPRQGAAIAVLLLVLLLAAGLGDGPR
jgi:hypothetical protein